MDNCVISLAAIYKIAERLKTIIVQHATITVVISAFIYVDVLVAEQFKVIAM